MVGEPHGRIGRLGRIAGGFHLEKRRRPLGGFQAHRLSARSSCRSRCCVDWNACWSRPARSVRECPRRLQGAGIDIDLILRQATRYPFYNTSQYALGTLGSTKTRQNLQDYIAHFSDNARVIFEQFDFSNTVDPARQGRRAVQDLQELRRHRPASRRGAGSGDEQPLRTPDPSLRRRGQRRRPKTS